LLSLLHNELGDDDDDDDDDDVGGDVVVEQQCMLPAVPHSPIHLNTKHNANRNKTLHTQRHWRRRQIVDENRRIFRRLVNANAAKSSLLSCWGGKASDRVIERVSCA
jgi:hypothetical protein